MDPVTVVVSAVALGASAGLRDAAAAAVKDAYLALKRLIGGRYANVDIEPVERRPESSAKRESLEEDLSAAGAATDEELLDAARKVIAAVERHPESVSPALGIDLERVKAAALLAEDIDADGTGLRVRDGEFSGDIVVRRMRAGQGPDRPR